MKSRLLALGFALFALPALAQEKADNYNVSVFRNSRDIVPSDRSASAATLQKVQQHFPGMKVKLDQISGSFTDIFGMALAIPGNDFNGKVLNCFNQSLSAFGLEKSDWQQVRAYNASHASFVTFEQHLGGHKVVFSRLNFRFTTDGRLERLQLKSYGSPKAGAVPVLTVGDATTAATVGLLGVSITDVNIDNNWVWFPIPTAQGYKLQPAYSFNIKGKGESLPLDLSGYVDAVTGNILYRSNHVKETVDLTVKGSVYAQNASLPATSEPLANLAMTINGNTYYTDSAGFFSDAVLAAPIVATVKLEGKWSKVRAAASSNVTPSYQENIVVLGGTSLFPVLSPSSDRHVNAYYHVNKVHDFMKSFYPAFTSMDNPLQTNVDVTGTCNAFYNGSSINFYPQGGGCNATSLCPDVVYHEYGHGISDKFYTWQGSTGGMNNGGLNEGNSDVWGISITQDPQLGKGFYTGNSSPLRRYDLAPKVYPQDLTGEVHADGEIIAGIWWDVAVNLNSPDTMTQLFTSTYYDTPDGPDGTEGDVYHQVLISALMNDDNDNNLSNGTPHFNQIVSAFAKHGIYLLGDAVVTHSEIAHPAPNTNVTINAAVTVATPAFLQGVKLFYRVRGAQWDSLAMVDNGGFNYSVQIPGKPAATIIDYYFTIYDFLAIKNAFSPSAYIPTAGSTSTTIPFQFAFGVDLKSLTDFEGTLTGWTVGNGPGDNATTAGIWIQAKPIGSYVSSGTLPCQPNMDHTTATTGKCLVTGNATSTTSSAGTADVDGASSTTTGRTTVITPVFDISNFTEPIVEYYRWYSNDRGNSPGLDYWSVQIKDSAAANWIFYVERTKKSDYAWRRRIFNVREYLPASTNFMMKFIAEDASPGSTVEAAVDDFFMYDKSVVNSVDDVTTSKANIFPNPANSEIFIKIDRPSEGIISLYDMAGKEIVKLSTHVGTSEYRLNTKAVAAGNYFLIIKTPKSVQSNKVSIVH